ncbi:hypothetical protein O0I10_011870 [Lichtheimia ornata]|uniref:Uncharacterized protein n=1 Tax=Lichtheimia ornata TaxID=688661 RepID=A0AAD7XQ24_9FUNG|nr:uncharacterized protein O0I10_011870 [Lichtheimia ornata]KAJ8652474.1 hypothetical protein O0I10_011870 [Lichtheimia ornata]
MIQHDNNDTYTTPLSTWSSTTDPTTTTTANKPFSPHSIEPIPRLSVSSSTTTSSAESTISSTNNDDPEQPPSKRQLIAGHVRSLSIALFRFLLKNNNWALVVNLLHHLWGARKLVIKKAPQAQRLGGSVAKDALRVIATMHLAFATLTGLALRHKRVSTDRSTLLVLALVALGQAWTYTRSFWQSGTTLTVKALRRSGLLDTFVFAVSSLAFSKTLRRSGRLF